MEEEAAVLAESRGRVGVLRLNRPKALNAINSRLIGELDSALTAMGSDREIGCVVITGGDKAFAAGADVREMQAKTYVDSYLDDFLARWDDVAAFRKPMVAAVSGFALGGGCELALMCDVILASETAQFGQPEIKLGILPGAGGTQRLTRAIGKAKAMDLCLTGRTMGAEEAERAGLVSRIVPAGQLLEEAVKVAETIASMSLPIAMMIKESVNASYEAQLSEGLRAERRLFYSAFATEDQKEGMSAFTEKRTPRFRNR
jgi:enoyl-CoA hydratase